MIKFFKTIFTHVKSFKLLSGIVLLGLLVEVGYETGLPMSLKFLIDQAIIPQNESLLVFILILLVVVGLVIYGILIYTDYAYARLSSLILKNIQIDTFRKLQNQPLSFFSGSRGSDITSQFTSDLAAIEGAVVHSLPTLLSGLLGITLQTIFLFLMEWRMALLVMLSIPFTILGPRVLNIRAAHVNRHYHREQSSLLGTIQENTRAQMIVKTFGLENVEIDKFVRRSELCAKVALRCTFLSYSVLRTANAGLIVFNLMIICIGAFLAFKGYLSIGALVAFNAVFEGLSESLHSLTEVLPHLIHAQAGMQRMESISKEMPSVKDQQGARELENFEQGIAFESISFGYEGNLNLKDLSLTIKCGSHTVFYGTSGSGKSTIINLLLRFYESNGGSIKIDGSDIKEFTQASLRSLLGVVFKENYIFNGSIRENIRIGKPEASDDEVEQAAHLAGMNSFVAALPEGFETSVSHQSSTLSAEQRQRIAIARAVIREPKILIFDEITATLDPASESSIMKTLDEIITGRTVITITHRLLPVLTKAQTICLVEHGTVVEQGSHYDLLDLHGHYWEFIQKQNGLVLSEDGSQAHIDVTTISLFPIFNSLTDDLLREIIPFFNTERFTSGRTIIRQGDDGDKFYIIVRGRVEVIRETEHGIEQRIALLEDGDCFGEMALLKNIPRNATVRVLDSTVVLSLQRNIFNMIVSHVPELHNSLESIYLHRSGLVKAVE